MILKILFSGLFFTLSGLPANSQTPAYIKNRMEALGGLGAAVCAYNQRILTERQSQEMADDFLRRNPNLDSAANWVTETYNGKTSMRIMLDFFRPDCKSFRNLDFMTKSLMVWVKEDWKEIYRNYGEPEDSVPGSNCIVLDVCGLSYWVDIHSIHQDVLTRGNYLYNKKLDFLDGNQKSIPRDKDTILRMQINCKEGTIKYPNINWRRWSNSNKIETTETDFVCNAIKVKQTQF